MKHPMSKQTAILLGHALGMWARENGAEHRPGVFDCVVIEETDMLDRLTQEVDEATYEIIMASMYATATGCIDCTYRWDGKS